MPTKHDGFIKAQLLRPFVDLAMARGCNVDAALKLYGLTKTDLRDPEKAVHAEIIYGLTNTLAEKAKDPHLGYHVADTFDMKTWLPTQDAFENARTIGDYYTRFLLNVPQQASSVRHTLTVTAPRATYAVTRTVQTHQRPVQVEGFGMGLHIRTLRHLSHAHWQADLVQLETPFPEALPKMPTGVNIKHSNVSGLSLTFPSSWLTLPVQPQDSRPNRPSTSVASASRDISIISTLRTAARPLLDDRTLTEQDFADALGLSPPRLKASLRLQNTTLPRELKRLRIDVAKEMFREATYSVATVAQALGYSDQSHFSRFFRSQTGQSPREYRATLNQN
ncbi:AraC family transcriptional regulator [uncultured Shimia sp.]|uniref:helix-turn-helix domain-containing protein n=1 Tax=uncultured Shimia sp. TaxID=573152 RepID=UPI002624DDEB|nr:AraC family transcriptional regulator [uncultured Shimia sp.]